MMMNDERVTANILLQTRQKAHERI